jgi:hypothetical protein
VRKKKKDNGTERQIDDNFKPETNIILFDDVTTRGGSVMQAVRERIRGIVDYCAKLGRRRCVADDVDLFTVLPTTSRQER